MYDGTASPCPENLGRLWFQETMGYTLQVRKTIVSCNIDRLDDLKPTGDGLDAEIYTMLNPDLSFSRMEEAITNQSTALAAKVLRRRMECTSISLT